MCLKNFPNYISAAFLYLVELEHMCESLFFTEESVEIPEVRGRFRRVKLAPETVVRDEDVHLQAQDRSAFASRPAEEGRLQRID